MVYSSLSHINLHANLIDLICFVAVKHLLTIPQPPLININNKIVSNIFHPNQATTTLQQIALNNAVQSSFIFYTDGSVTDIGTDHCSMGIGWVQILNNQVLHQFLASIKLWPSSYRAELMAILSAITTVSRNS